MAKMARRTYVNFPLQTTETFVPVVIFQAPLTLTAPTGIANGIKVTNAVVPPPGKE